MENSITITNTKDNFVQFDVNVDGVDSNSLSVRFVIDTSQMCLSFYAHKIKDDTWEVTVPSMPFVERTTYPFHIEVVVDGYYFEPFKGIVNVVGPVDIYTSTPKNTTLFPKTKYDGVGETIKSNRDGVSPSSLAARIMQDNTETVKDSKSLMENVHTRKPSGTKDAVVKDILQKSLNFQGRKRFSVRERG